jgi:hypothetical protein
MGPPTDFNRRSHAGSSALGRSRAVVTIRGQVAPRLGRAPIKKELLMGAVKENSILIACIGAGAAVVAAFAKPICDTLYPSSSERPAGVHASIDGAPGALITPTPMIADAPPIEGTWKQYVLSEDEGAVLLGTFVVAKVNGEYVISPRSQTEGEQFQNAIGVFDVAYDGNVWTYNTNWGNDEVGNFEFQRVSPTMFEGEIRVAGKLENRTRVVKIE